MASTGCIFPRCLWSSRCGRENQTVLPINPSPFLASKSLSMLKKHFLCSSIRIQLLKNPKIHASPIIVYAAQSDFFKVIQTAWKVAKDGIEAGTDLVPNTIPRAVARVSVSIAAVSVALFLLKSFLSTALFALAVMGLSYFGFIALNRGGKGGGGEEGTAAMDDSLEEARRIMDKYK